MTIHTAQQQLVFQLYHLYDDREAAIIADWVMEHITGWKKIDRIVNKKVPLSLEQQSLLERYTTDLLTHRPVQYVLQEAWFYGMKLYVDERVLIPRPETEELVEWIVKDVGQMFPAGGAPVQVPGAGGISGAGPATQKPENKPENGRVTPPASPSPPQPHLSILDIGTGSGCIAIALQKQLTHATVTACDVSEGALQVARKNAGDQGVNIQFLNINFLDPATWQGLPSFHVLVSNPPYIPLRDKDTMKANVVAYEPALALFVDNDDPLLFYRAIADFARHHLVPGGHIYTEIHEELGESVCELFSNAGMGAVTLRRDMQQKPRMVKATRLQ